MNAHEERVLAEVKAAMRGAYVRLNIVITFSHGDAVQVEKKVGNRWSKVGPLIFPAGVDTLADVLTMLATMRAEVDS